MNVDDNNSPCEGLAAVLPAGFGERLRQQREARGLTVEAVGQKLRIPIRVLHQLEQDDLSGIDTPLYLRGYVRAYTGLLGIDMPEGELQDARLAVTPLPLETSGGISYGRYLFARLSTAATYLAITALIVVPTVWIGLNGDLQRDIAQLVPLDGPQAGDRAASESLALPELAGAETSGKGPLKASMSPSFLFVDPDSVEDADAPVANRKPLEAVEPVQSASETDGETVATRPLGNSQAANSADGDAGVDIQLVLSQPSWVEITNSAGSRIEYALLVPGKYRYSGHQALSVLIGNASGADLYADGQQLDFKPFRHGDLARFRIDSSRGLIEP